MEKDVNERVAIRKIFNEIYGLYENKGYSFAFEITVEVFIEVLNNIIEQKRQEEENQNGCWESPLALKNIIVSGSYK